MRILVIGLGTISLLLTMMACGVLEGTQTGDSHAPAFAPLEAAPAKDLHCVAEAVPLSAGRSISPDVKFPETKCFATYREAILEATHGAVRLPPGASPRDVDMSAIPREDPLASYLIITEYVAPRYDIGWGSWTVSSSFGCQDQDLLISSLPIHDNAISSARLVSPEISGCNHAYHYEHPNYLGQVIDCGPPWSCYELGSLNDRVSSLRFTK
jgi:hypothetical protein